MTSEIIFPHTGHWHFKSDLKSLFPMYMACHSPSLVPPLPPPPSLPFLLHPLLSLPFTDEAGLYSEGIQHSLEWQV